MLLRNKVSKPDIIQHALWLPPPSLSPKANSQTSTPRAQAQQLHAVFRRGHCHTTVTPLLHNCDTNVTSL
jgi:hypothetical protein